MPRGYHYVQNRPIVVNDHGVLTTYENSRVAAAALGMKVGNIYTRISTGRPDNQGRYYAYEGEIPKDRRDDLSTDGRGALAVVAVGDKGKRVGFKSLTKARMYIGAPMSAIYRMLNQKTSEFGYRLFFGKVEPSGEITIRTELYSIAELPLSPAEIKEDARRMPGPELTEGCLYGFVDAEFGPVICPVCNQVLAMTPERYCRHLNRCLSGRRWRMLLGGRLEVSLDVDPDPVEHKFSLAER